MKEIFADAPNFQTKARPLQHGLGLLPLSAGALFKEPLKKFYNFVLFDTEKIPLGETAEYPATHLHVIE